jgi:hypothetical protein
MQMRRRRVAPFILLVRYGFFSVPWIFFVTWELARMNVTMWTGMTPEGSENSIQFTCWSFSLLFRRSLVRILAGTPTVLLEVSSVSPQSIHNNYGSVPCSNLSLFSLQTDRQLYQISSILNRISDDRLYGLVVRIPGCRLRGSGFDSRRY